MSNVLCIEPNTVLARTYVQALEHVGFQVAQAATAQDAVHAADAQTPDVVLLELQMAVHDGIEFLHEFRSYPEWQEIPVVLLTNMLPTIITPLQATLERDLGVTAYLYKPHTSLEKLIRVVRQQVATV